VQPVDEQWTPHAVQRTDNGAATSLAEEVVSPAGVRRCSPIAKHRDTRHHTIAAPCTLG